MCCGSTRVGVGVGACCSLRFGSTRVGVGVGACCSLRFGFHARRHRRRRVLLVAIRFDARRHRRRRVLLVAIRLDASWRRRRCVLLVAIRFHARRRWRRRVLLVAVLVTVRLHARRLRVTGLRSLDPGVGLHLDLRMRLDHLLLRRMDVRVRVEPALILDLERGPVFLRSADLRARFGRRPAADDLRVDACRLYFDSMLVQHRRWRPDDDLDVADRLVVLDRPRLALDHDHAVARCVVARDVDVEHAVAGSSATNRSAAGSRRRRPVVASGAQPNCSRSRATRPRTVPTRIRHPDPAPVRLRVRPAAVVRRRPRERLGRDPDEPEVACTPSARPYTGRTLVARDVHPADIRLVDPDAVRRELIVEHVDRFDRLTRRGRVVPIRVDIDSDL